MNRRCFIARAALGALGAGAGTLLYTTHVEPHWVHVVPRELPVDDLPPALAGARVVQISDLHAGPQVDDDYLVHAFDDATALRPDIVVITGDFLTYVHERGTPQFAQLRRVLAHLPHGRLATLGILGNHDYGRGWSEPDVAARVLAEAERAGVRMLRNEVAAVAGLDVVGVDDLWARQADPLAALGGRTGAAAITLCHNPDALDDLSWGAYRGWILSGHTHGGQCKPPFLPPPLLPVRNRLYAAGEVHLRDGRRLYVNRGLGHLARVRFNVRPEITLFTLRRAVEKAS